MWFPTRHMILVAVAILVILLVLIGKVEGLTSSCRTSLAKYDEDKKTYVTGEGPPLDAKQCKGEVVGKGKNSAGKKQCWVGKDDGTWEKSDKTDCKSWTKIVAWKSKTVRDEVGKRPWASVDGWQRKVDMNFGGSGDLGGKEAENTAECAKRCDDNNSECKGFVFQKSNKNCWGVNAARVGDVSTNLKKEKGMYAFYRKSGGTTGSNAETTAAGASSAGKYKGSGKNEKAREGNFFFRVKGGQTSAVIGSKDSYTYIKFNAVESKGGCNNSDDNRQIIVASDTKGKTAAEASGQYPSYMIWGLRPGEGGGGKWRIFNQAHLDANCGYNRLSTDWNAQNTNCETQGRKVMFSSWGDWYLFPSGKGYKFRAANCGPEGKGAWLYVGANGADMTSEQNATTIYLEKAIAA